MLLELQARGHMKEVGSDWFGPQSRMLHQYGSKSFVNLCMYGLKSLF